jgi:CubicO group peptidase (beta-lactamase class C family)
MSNIMISYNKFNNENMKKILTLSLFLIGSIGLKGQTPDMANKIDSIVNVYVTKETPGCVVGVVKDGKILYKQTYGMSNLDYRIPVTDSTLFNLASVSKQFTAFLVLLLEGEGKLNLDDSIQKYIPEVGNYGHKITIRQLLHHTSGIPPSDNLRMFAGLSLEMPWDAEDEFNMIQSYHKLNFKPNEENDYSNAGYFLLARIIEKASGQPFSQCIKEKVFQPLNMTTSCIYDTPGKVILNRASSYRKVGSSFFERNSQAESVYGFSNMYASVNDLINWCKNLTNKSLGGQRLVDRLFNPIDTLNNGDTITYTYGLFATRHKGLKMVFHEGSSNGFRAYIGHFPREGFSVVVLSNAENTDVINISLQIAELYLKDNLVPEIIKEHKEVSINKELYELYKGSYIIPEGIVFSFDNVNDTLKLIIPGAPKFVMYPEKDNEFFLKDFDAQCTFVKNSKGKVDDIIWHQNNQNTKGVRYTEPKPLTEKDLQSFTGEYEISVLNVTYPVSLKDNELFITLPKTFRQVNIDTDLKLNHMSGDKFIGTLGLIEFKRNKEGKIVGFVIADVGRLKNIEFTKKNEVIQIL